MDFLFGEYLLSTYWAMSILCEKHGNVVQQHFIEHFEFQAFTAVYLGSMQDQA